MVDEIVVKNVMVVIMEHIECLDSGLVFERKRKYLSRPDYGEDIFSFTTYFGEKRYDYLMPRIYMTILEKEEGCVLNIYYRIKGEIIFSYSF